MNTRELAQLDEDDRELKALVVAFVREFHRLPSGGDLEKARARRGTAPLPA